MVIEPDSRAREEMDQAAGSMFSDQAIKGGGSLKTCSRYGISLLCHSGMQRCNALPPEYM